MSANDELGTISFEVPESRMPEVECPWIKVTVGERQYIGQIKEAPVQTGRGTVVYSLEVENCDP